MPAMFAISKVTASQPITSQSSPFGFGNLASHSALRSDTEALGRAPPSEPVARYNLRKETSLTSRFCSTASAVSNHSGSFDSTGTPSSPAAGLPSTMNRMAPCLVRSLTPNKYSDSLTRVRLRLRENTFLPPTVWGGIRKWTKSREEEWGQRAGHRWEEVEGIAADCVRRIIAER